MSVLVFFYFLAEKITENMQLYSHLKDKVLYDIESYKRIKVIAKKESTRKIHFSEFKFGLLYADAINQCGLIVIETYATMRTTTVDVLSQFYYEL